MTQQQIEAVLKLEGPARYDHFIKVVADRGQAWGLHCDGWALAGEAEGIPVFPLWPAKEYAELCAAGDWSGYQPQAIDVDDIFDGLLPSLRERNTLLGVFPTPEGKGVVPDLEDFERDLTTELARLE